MISLRIVLKDNQVYFNKKTIEDKRLNHEISANLVKSFIYEVVDETSTCDESITKDELYEHYLMFCNKRSMPEKKEMFGKELKKSAYKDGRENKGENRRTLGYGIRIKMSMLEHLY